MAPSDLDAFDLLQQITDQYLDRDLDRSEVIKVRNATTQHLVPLMDHPQKIFILGSFDEKEKTRLRAVQALFDSLYRIEGLSRARVYTMDDIPGKEMWINLDIKFRLLADIADNLVGIAEHGNGGFMFEQGVLATNPDYRDKTLLLKREYDSIEQEHDHYSAMQSKGLFDELDRRDQLFRWRNWEELINATEDIFQNIESED